MLFKELGLMAELLRAVEKQGYNQATPIQQQAIPAILAGHDVLAAAQTGTGKTAGFTLPLLQRLQSSAGAKRGRVRALILTPTRELAAQVEESVTVYGRYLNFRSLTIFGGVNIRPQIARLRQGVEIVVATPGRLLDHMQQGTVDLSDIEILVLDEADRMLDMGFIRDMRRIFKVLPAERQTLMFSATFSRDIRKLAGSLLRAPREIQVAPENATADRVSQVVYPVDRSRKRALLAHQIHEENWQQVLVFTRTKHGANRLAQQLGKDGIEASAIHGNKSQAARTRALADFKRGGVRVLVATDIAARGLDIDSLPHVVNFELPNVPEDYVHRIGRTARAGLDGEAVSLVCVDEHKLLSDIEKLLGRKLDKRVIDGFTPDPTIAAQPLQNGRGRPGGRAQARPGKKHAAGNRNARPGGRRRNRSRAIG